MGVLVKNSKIALMTPFIFLIGTQTNFEKRFEQAELSVGGYAKTFGASTPCILRPCVV